MHDLQVLQVPLSPDLYLELHVVDRSYRSAPTPAAGTLPAHSQGRTSNVIVPEQTADQQQCWMGIAGDMAISGTGISGRQFTGGRMIVTPNSFFHRNLLADSSAKSTESLLPYTHYASLTHHASALVLRSGHRTQAGTGTPLDPQKHTELAHILAAEVDKLSNLPSLPSPIVEVGY